MKKLRIATLVIAMAMLFSTVCIFAFFETNADDVVTNVKVSELENDVVKNLGKAKTKGENVQNDVEYYTYFVSVLQPSEEENKYINKLIDKGYNIEALVKIFDFWRYTNEDISIIEKVYELKPEDISISYWVDEAFIQLSKKDKTNYSYIGLSVEQVQSYMDQGITADEILAADKISRKGIKTVEEILDERLKEITWVEIVTPIYKLELSDDELAKLKDIVEPDEFIEAEKIAKRNNKKTKDVLIESLSGEKCAKQNFDFKNRKMNEAKETLKQKNIWDDSKKKEKPKAFFGEEALF